MDFLESPTSYESNTIEAYTPPPARVAVEPQAIEKSLDWTPERYTALRQKNALAGLTLKAVTYDEIMRREY